MAMMLGLSGGTGAWNPKALDATFWLRGDLGVTQSSNAISAWADQSVNGITVTQGTAGAKPTYSATGGPNNKPCVTFDGGDTLTALTIAQTTVFGASAGTVGIVMNPTGGTGGVIPCMWYQTVNSNNMYLYLNTASNTIKFEYGDDTNGNSTSTLMTVDAWHYYVITCVNSTTHTAFKDGVADGNSPFTVTSSVLSSANGTIDIGSYGGAVAFTGAIAEIVWFKTALGTADGTALGDYFAARHGL